ncbi:LysR substrate-binding domain-containing protein [Dongia sp.]|uniref:LysR substrate-binding domain-containing protein n=1 Tax=Dongia sp. TaxID=1977262 RepID=UPI0035B4A63F
MRAFNAAARHGGFAGAARELGVSPGAVSRQVKILELHVDADLFKRNAHGVVLTATGERLLALTERAFDLLHQAMPGQAPDRSLAFQVSASFYLRWLLPRYLGLQADLPRAKVELAIASRLGADDAGADLSIRYHRFDAVPTDDRLSERLFADGSVAVAAPTLLGRRKTPLPLKALRRLPLLLNTPDGWDWRIFAQVNGIDPLPLNAAQQLDMDDAAIQAVLAGAGVALVEQRFVSDLLHSGQLVRLFDLPALSLGEYRLHWRSGIARRAIVADLRRWFKGEIAAQIV